MYVRIDFGEHLINFVDDEVPMNMTDDPMSHIEMTSSVGDPVRVDLTAAGIRIALGRRTRGKPLLKIMCHGCDRTSHSPDTYIDGDYLEWAPGYYKLTQRMKAVGVTEAQPSGPFCKDCSETCRRGYPSERKEEVVNRLDSNKEFKYGEFKAARETYIEDMRQRIASGGSRLKKRQKSVPCLS